MAKVFTVTIDGDYIIVAGQKGIIFAGRNDQADPVVNDFVKFINCD